MPNLVTRIDAPRVVHLSITDACNWDCFFCSAHKKSGKFYPTQIICKVLERINEAGVATVVLYGGEPTLNPDFIKIGKYAKDIGLDVGIITNGAGVKRENIDQIAEVFSVAAVSIHSFRRIHDIITTVKGSFDRAIRALDMLTTEGLPTLENVTVTPLNLFNFNKFIKFLHHRYPQILEFNVNRATFTGKGKEYVLNRAEIVEMVRSMAKLKEEGIPVKPGVPIPPCILPSELRRFATFCSAGTLFADITGDGLVRPCSNIGQNDILGNILEKDLQELWNSEKVARFRSCEWIPEQCKNCQLFTNCFCGCKRTPEGAWRVDPIINEVNTEYYIANPHNRFVHVNDVEAIMSNKGSPAIFESDDLKKVKRTLEVLKAPNSTDEIANETGITESELKTILRDLLGLGIITKIYRKDISQYNIPELFQAS